MTRSAIIALALLCSSLAHGETLTGFISAITDGDTLVLLDDQKSTHKIRVNGIDAPEKAQAFGAKSTAHLGSLAFNRTAVADCPKTDRYGRKVCKVVVDGQDVGLAQIRAGMAWWFERYKADQTPEDRETYAGAEAGARQQRVGLWVDRSPMAPWEWRKGRK